jgi:hypothetical protein
MIVNVLSTSITAAKQLLDECVWVGLSRYLLHVFSERDSVPRAHLDRGGNHHDARFERCEYQARRSAY